MHKTNIAIAVGTLFFLCAAGTSYAADTDAKQPLDQAVKSVDKNLAKDPDNKGLQNAAGRLQTNKERHDKKRAEKDARHKAKVAEKDAKRQAKMNERAEKNPEHRDAERTEKMEHMEKSSRPEKMERPEKAERPGKMDRPNR